VLHAAYRPTGSATFDPLQAAHVLAKDHPDAEPPALSMERSAVAFGASRLNVMVGDTASDDFFGVTRRRIVRTSRKLGAAEPFSDPSQVMAETNGDVFGGSRVARPAIATDSTDDMLMTWTVSSGSFETTTSNLPLHRQLSNGSIAPFGTLAANSDPSGEAVFFPQLAPLSGDRMLATFRRAGRSRAGSSRPTGPRPTRARSPTRRSRGSATRATSCSPRPETPASRHGRRPRASSRSPTSTSSHRCSARCRRRPGPRGDAGGARRDRERRAGRQLAALGAQRRTRALRRRAARDVRRARHLHGDRDRRGRGGQRGAPDGDDRRRAGARSGGDDQTAPPRPTGVPRDVTPPALTALRLTRAAFRVGPGATALSAQRRRRTPAGTTLSYGLSEAAQVTIAVEQRRRGFRSGRRCVARRPSGSAGRRARRCTLHVVRGTLRRAGVAGANRLTFTGRLGRRSLPRAATGSRWSPRTRPATCPRRGARRSASCGGSGSGGLGGLGGGRPEASGATRSGLKRWSCDARSESSKATPSASSFARTSSGAPSAVCATRPSFFRTRWALGSSSLMSRWLSRRAAAGGAPMASTTSE
jgi:hypothetical protein